MSNRISATLLTGYLGSGKTTLINHLLAGDDGVRIAVLVNDFGAVNIDASLIADASDQTISLTNGCVCCSIADDLGAALDAQVARTDPPQHIVIEASGVAEPARILHYANGWPGLGLDSVVAMIDAETIRKRATDKFVGRVVKRQLAAADFLILNKCDLVSVAELQELRNWLSDHAPSAQIVEATHAVVDPQLILGPQINRKVRNEPVEDHVHDATATFATTIWQTHEPVDLSLFEAAIRSLPSSVHRLKGFVSDATGQRLLVQVVGRRCVINEMPGRDHCGTMSGQIIAIATVADDLVQLPRLLDETVNTVSRPHR